MYNQASSGFIQEAVYKIQKDLACPYMKVHNFRN